MRVLSANQVGEEILVHEVEANSPLIVFKKGEHIGFRGDKQKYTVIQDAFYHTSGMVKVKVDPPVWHAITPGADIVRL